MQCIVHVRIYYNDESTAGYKCHYWRILASNIGFAPSRNGGATANADAHL